MATGCDDDRLRILDAATGAVEQEVPHEGIIFSMAWSPSGTKVATGSDDKLATGSRSAGRARHAAVFGSVERGCITLPCLAA